MHSLNDLIQSSLAFFFKHLYTTFAWGYDMVAFLSSMGQWHDWQRVGIDALPQGRILEIGFGTGFLLHELINDDREICGIDPSRQMAQITSHRLKKHEIPQKLCQAKAQNLPFSKESFHSVLSTFPSDYILDEETISEAWRVLVPNGSLVIVPGVLQIFGLRGKRSVLSLLDEISSILYRITGESMDIDDAWKEKFSWRMMQLGFSVRIEPVHQSRAVVLRIIARKRSHPGPAIQDDN